MKEVRWDPLKSQRLKKTRGISFEEIIHRKLVDIQDHLARENQRVFLFEVDRYLWVVPFVEREDHIFLKTLYPSRKYTKIYRKGRAKS